MAGRWRVRSVCPQNVGWLMRGGAMVHARPGRRDLRSGPNDIVAACLSQVWPQRAWALHQLGVSRRCGRATHSQFVKDQNRIRFVVIE